MQMSCTWLSSQDKTLYKGMMKDVAAGAVGDRDGGATQAGQEQAP